MAPKKDKGGKDVTDENYWRTVIEESPLDDDIWKVKVILIEAAGSDEDRNYLNKFEIFAAEEKRFVIKNICKTETIFMINQLGGEKKVKDDNLRVFEEGQSYLKDKKDIPPEIQALIIKHLILKMKDEYLFIKRQRLEVREGMRRESTTMVEKTEVRGTVCVKPPEPPEPPPPPPKGKSKVDETNPVTLPTEPEEGKKYNTMLRVRGEEWRDKVYVDDYPIDGPNLYVAVTGFVEPQLPSCLLKIGIPLTAIVQLRIDPTKTEIPATLSRVTKRGQSQTELLVEKSLKFWEELQLLRINKNTSDVFKNTAFIVFSPPYWHTEMLSGSPGKIYDELCYLMYDVQDLTRQHAHYLENMGVIKIPEDVSVEHFYKYYLQQIEDIPLECITIYSVLDSILTIVCDSQNVDEKSPRSSLSTALTLNVTQKPLTDDEKVNKAQSLVKEIFSTLCKTDADKKLYRLTYGEEYEAMNNPIIINYGDYAKYTTYHLGNINLDNIVWCSLVNMPINSFWKQQNRPQGELEAKINFHINVLLSCFERTDVETAELNRLIHILACRKLYNNRSSIHKKHPPPTTISEFKKFYLKRSVLAEPLPKCSSVYRTLSTTSPSFPSMARNDNVSYDSSGDDSEARRIRCLFDCPDISELVSAAEIANEKPINHLIDDFEYFEDFSGISAFQIMLEAFNKFNCINYKYCEVTDCFVLMFFNSHDQDGIARDEWRSHLPSPLCLQDFFDFVLEEHYDWIKDQEAAYDETVVLNRQSTYKDQLNSSVVKSCVETTEVDLDLLMEGSLKHKEMTQTDELSPEISQSKEVLLKKTAGTISSTEADSKSSKKTKTPLASTPKNLGQSFFASGITSAASVTVPSKPFFGYNLGERRVEVFGKDTVYFSKDGTRVSTAYTLLIPLNLEYVIMNVVPGKSCNEIWVHKALGEDVKPEVFDSCESFRITTKDLVMINVKKQVYYVPLPVVSIPFAEEQKHPENYKDSSVKFNQLPEIFETRSFHSLFVTWPNGLITETVHEKNSPVISHIKQYHVSRKPDNDEDMRCVSLNGEVLIFKKFGDILVLKPDGSCLTITKSEKRLVIPETLEETHSEISSDKSKKSKVKDKGKDKPSKATSKSSKNRITDEDRLSEEKQPEYELIIHEFEVIETSGLKQKWVNGNVTNIEKLIIRKATDYCLGEVFSRRMDGTYILLNKDGIHIVTFPDKTRIITNYVVEEEEVFPEWSEEEREYFDLLDTDSCESSTNKSKGSISQKSAGGVSYTYNTSVASSIKKIEEEEVHDRGRKDGYISVQIIYTIEHINFTTVTINKSNGKITVDSPNGTSVEVDSECNYNMTLDSATSAKFNSENLHINYEACSECRSYTTCDIKIASDEMSSVTRLHKKWLKMKDSFCKRIAVNEEGSINVVEESHSDEVINIHEDTTNNEEAPDNNDDKQTERKSESSLSSHGKCREMYLAKTIRFFILKRDLTCAEVVHRSLLEQYKLDCRWQPWCSINQYDTFGDHRSLISLLTPVYVTESEKWLMESKLADKPKYLTYKDLKPDSGKGFYDWMRPYKRFEPKPMKPATANSPLLPKAFVSRTLELQWKEENRSNLKGAKELLSAILRYRRLMESDCESLLNIPIIDPRPDYERRIDDVIQALAHKIYEDLKVRLADDVQSRARADITTKPQPFPEEVTVEDEMVEEVVDEARALEEERDSLLKQVEEAEDMSPNLKRYWRRRAEELKEEQFYQYLLREGNVPPYFRNVLGGSIWWEMNNAAGDAVTKSERRKMKCVCPMEEESQSDDHKEPYM